MPEAGFEPVTPSESPSRYPLGHGAQLLFYSVGLLKYYHTYINGVFIIIKMVELKYKQ